VPFTSEAPRRSLWAKHPQSAQSWAHLYPHQGHLPRHVRGQQKHPQRARVPAVFSRLGRRGEADQTSAGPAAALYVVPCALWPSQLPFRGTTASLNPAPASPNSRAAVQPQQAQQAPPHPPPQLAGTQAPFPFFSRMAKLTGDYRFPLDSLSVYRKSHSRFLGDFAVLQPALPSLLFFRCRSPPRIPLAGGTGCSLRSGPIITDQPVRALRRAKRWRG